MTNYALLQYFFKQQDLDKHQIQWFQELIDTPISIAYLPGKQATVPDALSPSLILHESMDNSADYQLLVRSCFVPFVANSISLMIRIQTMHPSSSSVTSVGTTLAFVILLLVWHPMNLQNTI